MGDGMGLGLGVCEGVRVRLLVRGWLLVRGLTIRESSCFLPMEEVRMRGVHPVIIEIRCWHLPLVHPNPITACLIIKL